jgi:hypothetical protein
LGRRVGWNPERISAKFAGGSVGMMPRNGNFGETVKLYRNFVGGEAFEPPVVCLPLVRSVCQRREIQLTAMLCSRIAEYILQWRAWANPGTMKPGRFP